MFTLTILAATTRIVSASLSTLLFRPLVPPSKQYANGVVSLATSIHIRKLGVRSHSCVISVQKPLHLASLSQQAQLENTNSIHDTPRRVCFVHSFRRQSHYRTVTLYANVIVSLATSVNARTRSRTGRYPSPSRISLEEPLRSTLPFPHFSINSVPNLPRHISPLSFHSLGPPPEPLLYLSYANVIASLAT